MPEKIPRRKTAKSRKRTKVPGSGDVSVEVPAASPGLSSKAPTARAESDAKSTKSESGGRHVELSADSATHSHAAGAVDIHRNRATEAAQHGNPDLAAPDQPVEDNDKGAGGSEPSGFGTKQLLDIGPLANVEGRFVRISDLAALLTTDGKQHFSRAVLDVLERARREPRLISEEGYPVVDAWAYLRAAILVGSKQAQGRPSEENVHQFLVEWFTNTALDLDGIGKGQVLETSWVESENDGPSGSNDGDMAGSNAVAHPELTQIIADAARIVQRTHKFQSRIDARHMILAILRSEPGRGALAELDLIDPSKQSDFVQLVQSYRRYRLDHAFTSEPAEAWEEVWSELDTARIPDWAKPSEPIVLYHPSYDSDEVVRLSDDALGVAKDVRSLAELICLKDANPPLAIGLFGDWGAGKSTFMEMLEEAIDDVTTRASKESRLPFVRRVAHIRFNAWHYMDATLWASLVTHIFKELHKKSRNKEHPLDWLQETQLDALFQELGVVKDSERQAEEKIADLDSESKSFQEQLDKIERERAAENKKLISEYGKALIEAIPVPDLDGAVEKGYAALGLGSKAPTARQLSTTIEEAATLGGRMKLLVTTFSGGAEKPIRYAIFGVTVFLLVGALTALAAVKFNAVLPGLENIAGALGPIFGLIAGFATWIRPHLSFLNEHLGPLIDAHNQVMESLDKRENERAKLEVQVKERLEDLRVEQYEKERELKNINAERQRLEAIARGDRPTELLTRFIEDRASAEGYQKHLGLLSFIRQDFETVSRLMHEQREKEAAGNKSDDKIPIIDRIILYIDDLDRCQHKQVVQVLEAVHLLLAFDLFVVVVGVDARWLQHSLEKVYPDQLAGRSETQLIDGAGATNPYDAPATAFDYLEKIFQVPFWLRPLDFGNAGTYQSLLSNFFGSEILVTLHKDNEPDILEDRDNGEEQAAVLTPVQVILPPVPKETPDQTLRRVTITDKEFKLMKKLGPLAGKSPRAVKRFVNLYRLIRARRHGDALTNFVEGATGMDGDALKAPEYPAIMFWLAAEVGLPAKVIQAFEFLVSELGTSARDVVRNLANSREGEFDALQGRQMAASRDLQSYAGRISAAFDATVQLLDESNWPEAFLAGTNEPSRYSFRRATGRPS